MQERLKQIIDSLGVAEKEVIEKNYLVKLQLWARILDEVEAGLPFIEDISNSTQNFNQCKQQFEQITNSIQGLNIAQDASRVTQIQQYVSNFKQYFNQLVDLKQKIQAVTEDKTDVSALKRVVADAKKQRQEFEKSFQDSLEKQASGSQRVLAAHFKKRLEELKKDTSTNPKDWLKKRNTWLFVLVAVIFVLAGFYTWLITIDSFKGFELSMLALKVAIVTAIYLQYHFATRNYHIYADMVARYEHLAVISETMTDFTAASFQNEELNTAVYTNAAKTLFGEINTGHTKQAAGNDSTLVENVINQLPKAN